MSVGHRVLIVDKHEDQAERLAGRLEELGFEARRASGDEVILDLLGEGFQSIVLDLMMSRTDGIQTIRQLPPAPSWRWSRSQA